MESIAKRLHIALDASGMSQTDLSKRTGINKASISTYLSGTYEPKQKNVFRLAEALDVSPSWLMGLAVPMREIPRDAPSDFLPPPKTYRVPILGEIACGEPIEAIENRDEFVEAPDFIKCDFALRCKGDSMTGARINDGDLVYIRSQPQVESGQIAAVMIDGETTLKKVYYHPNSLVLMPANPAYEPIILNSEVIDSEYVRVLGLAVGFTSTSL